MVNSKPDFALRIENASKIAPCHCKVGLGFDCLQVASLEFPSQPKPVWWGKDGNIRKG